MPLHVLTNFEIHKYYQKEISFNGIYSRVQYIYDIILREKRIDTFWSGSIKIFCP